MFGFCKQCVRLRPQQCFHCYDSAISVEWYLYPVHCGVVLGPWACRGARKWNRRQARKRRFCSEVSRTRNFLGNIETERKKNHKRLDGKTSISYCVVVLVIHRDRLQNWFLNLTWLQGPDYCPLIGHNPWLLLVFLPDITPWGDIYM